LKKYKKLQNYKTFIRRKDGKKVPINLSVSTMKSGSGSFVGALVIAKEVGGENYREYDNNESDRLAAIVETAVAVNHAINNPLVPILGNIQVLLQNQNIKDDDVRRRLRIIRNNAMRIRDITKKLAKINHPVTIEYLKGTRMLDIEASI
jgi:nitrogen-specific signal transduction histidine kinase